MPTITAPPAPAPPAPPSDYSVLPAPAQAWTEADLLRLGHDDHRQYELVRGELRQMSPANSVHGNLEFRFAVALGKYLEQHPLGEGYTGDTGFQLSAEPLTIRSPDLAFIRTERLPTGSRPAFLPLAPDLVIEIVSPSESARTIAEKVSDYLAAGTRLLWIVYPEQQHVHEYRAAHAFHIYHAGDTLDGRDVLPGFRFALAALFG
ncbi:MAG: Uma2 family endonuclease [Chloroflexaceae bacterium]|nr:Uma2 family endonuclease [Chloroflexaceae bacterium]